MITVERDPERVRAVVRDVLRGDEFAGAESDQALFRKFTEWLGHLADRLTTAIHDMPPWASRLVTAWMVVTLLAIVGHTLYTLFLLGGRGPRSALSRRAAMEGELLGVHDLDFDRVHAEALRARDSGDLERAIRYGYAACILFLDRVGCLSFDTSKTNSAYAREVRQRRETESAVFDHATAAFEAVAYGPEPATLSVANGVLGDLEALKREALSRSSARSLSL